MNKDLNSKGNLKPFALFLSGGALFSMHFGASSMVWPMNWGKDSGTSLLPAFLGAFITALLLVIAGYLALAKENQTYTTLTERLGGKRFGLVFAAFTILINGPFYCIPRMSAAAWDSVVQAVGLETDSRLPLIIFTVVFYVISYLFLSHPGKAMDRISNILFPALIVIVVAVIGKGLLKPLAEPVVKAYDSSAFAYGFTGGYATGEVLCAMIFGAVIVNSLKTKGVADSALTKNMIRVGIAGVGLLTLTHFFHMVIGSTSASVFPELNYTALYTAVATALYGKAGGVLFCVALFMAALTTAIGMTSGCAEFFVDATGGKFNYKQLSLSITVLSILFGCMGLNGILTVLGPILDGVYPPVIILVLYFSLVKKSNDPRMLCGGRLAFFVSFFFGMTDMIWKYLVKFDAMQGLQDLYVKIPLASVSLAWIPWAAAAFLIGCFAVKNKKKA